MFFSFIDTRLRNRQSFVGLQIVFTYIACPLHKSDPSTCLNLPYKYNIGQCKACDKDLEEIIL